MGEAARRLDLETVLSEPGCPAVTLLELVAAIAEEADSDAEILAAVTSLINSGQVRLIGSFRGADVRIA